LYLLGSGVVAENYVVHFHYEHSSVYGSSLFCRVILEHGATPGYQMPPVIVPAAYRAPKPSGVPFELNIVGDYRGLTNG
jgi:hypothetical protein